MKGMPETGLTPSLACTTSNNRQQKIEGGKVINNKRGRGEGKGEMWEGT
jgi:hypothetical protein